MTIGDISIADMGAVIAVICGATATITLIINGQKSTTHIIVVIAAKTKVHKYAIGDKMHTCKAIMTSTHPVYLCPVTYNLAVLRIEYGAIVQLNKCTCQSYWLTS